MKFRTTIALLALALVACEPESAAVETQSAAARPNVLLVVVDDMGYADLGSFGGEIPTPNLDKLAYDGMRFTNLHGSTMCSPSRAMLLTGVTSHRSGFGNMLEELAPNQKGQPGYEGRLNDRVVTVATLLRDAGYRTYFSGKWHLGSDESGPENRGFEQSFSLDSGGASHFADMRPAYAPSPEIKANYRENGVQLSQLPEEFEYSTQYYADRMIEYLSAHDADQAPFFAYLSFTAPHWPLQAPDEAIARYAGRYDSGYDVLAEQRLQRQKELGLVPPDVERPHRSPKEMPWSELDDEQRKFEIRAMEVYAAMIDELDRHMGRVIAALDASGGADNTIIIFLSDNGPEGHDLDETWPMEAFPKIRQTIDAAHDFSYEAIGREGSYTLYGPNWANAGSPAFALHKAFPTEGGSRVAGFAYYPRMVEAEAVSDEFLSIIDITPTILELTGVEHPGSHYKDRALEPVSGISFAPLLGGESFSTSERVFVSELLGKRAVRKGDWKLVHMPSPWGSGEWQLYDLAEDLAERNNVAADNPGVVEELVAAWYAYEKENGVIIPDWVSGY